jgi:hypothetical protein
MVIQTVLIFSFAYKRKWNLTLYQVPNNNEKKNSEIILGGGKTLSGHATHELMKSNLFSQRTQLVLAEVIL